MHFLEIIRFVNLKKQTLRNGLLKQRNASSFTCTIFISANIYLQ